MIQLLCERGCLYTPRAALKDPILLAHYSENPILLHIYDAGDCDTIKWPDYNAESLRAALYAARETGCLPADTQGVLLPDGKEFVIDESVPCEFCGQPNDGSNHGGIDH